VHLILQENLAVPQTYSWEEQVMNRALFDVSVELEDEKQTLHARRTKTGDFIFDFIMQAFVSQLMFQF
jgi:hypothetical protein